jgi:2-keto-4-pentenoate hydratase/2-oxohepta-3-ene-1,7-dioic acid hydratase in catechol pathway
VSFDGPRGVTPGALRDGSVVDLGSCANSVLALLEGGEDARLRATDAMAGAEAFPLESVKLVAPIPVPRGHLYCVGWNYPKHYDEGVGKRAGQENDERAFPAFFTKPPTTVVGPEAPVLWDAGVTEQLDYEAELAVVIGRGGRSISADNALGHVAGYTLANDISARDIQRRHGGQWLKGKGMDTYCPMGPVLVTSDELRDPTALRLQARVNGESRQDELTGNMIFPIERLIAELSFGMTLYPGDIILTGTPRGTGFAREPVSLLVPGDVVEVEIEEIGVLRNPIEKGLLGAEAVASSTAGEKPASP